MERTSVGCRRKELRVSSLLDRYGGLLRHVFLYVMCCTIIFSCERVLYCLAGKSQQFDETEGCSGKTGSSDRKIVHLIRDSLSRSDWKKWTFRFC